jgi:outer membrane protein OmpA-like peptidoglycan-associated protein
MVGRIDSQMQTQMRSAPSISLKPVSGIAFQRKCACGQHTISGGECTECRRKRLSIQRRAANQAAPATVPPIVHEVLHSPGQPLDPDTRTFMEPRFGHDFSRVRVHTDTRAGESARAVNALAYTLGQDVVFGAGQYAPETTAGKRLLAHELAHTVQQGRGAILTRCPLEVGPLSDVCEHEANWVADRITAEGVTLSRDFTPVGPSVQRVCGSRAIGRPSGCIPLGGVRVFDIARSSDELYVFEVSCDDFKPGHEGRLRGLAARFGPSDVIEIHGFASEEGPIDFNEHLSCARALKAKSVLTGAGISPTSIGAVFKHGATPGPRPEHRSVVIPLPTPMPAPSPTRPTPVISPPQPESEPEPVQPQIPTGCTPNPHGTHLPPVGTAHRPPAHMLPCLLTEDQVRASRNWCLDAQQRHRGETCYREIPSSYCASADQYCYTADGCCHNSRDQVSPVDPNSPGEGHTCTNAYRCFPRHVWEDVF